MRNTPAPTRGTWATYIKAAREAAILSQSELARRLHTDRTTIWRWENARQAPENADTVADVARVLGLDLEEALAAAGLRPGVQPPARPTVEPDPELDLVRTDPRLTEDQKRRIIELVLERRTRDRQASLEETRRIIDITRRAG